MMDSRDGVLRQPEDPASKPWDPKFTAGELLSIKSCWFRVDAIRGDAMLLRPVSDQQAQREGADRRLAGNRRERRSAEAAARKRRRRLAKP